MSNEPGNETKRSEKIRLLVLGAGPGGYTAAFLAADRGMDVTLVDERSDPGGVCLFVGCIPSKALLHAARILEEAKESRAMGIHFGDPGIDLEALRAYKDSVVQRLTGGVGGLAERRKVRYVRGRGAFLDAKRVRVDLHDGGSEELTFDAVIVATGSDPVRIPGFPEDDRLLWDSTAALELREIPPRLLVVGGGYIGLELGSVYGALGSRITVVEMTDSLLMGADSDLVRPLQKRLEERFEAIHLSTRVESLTVDGDGLRGIFSDKSGAKREERFDRALVSVGRRPRTKGFGLDSTGVALDDHGFIRVDEKRRTNIPGIYAIGDVAGQPMLAHVASYEGKVAVEAILGEPASYDPVAIPAVVFTDPEIAWCGLTESAARNAGRSVEVARFPWSASGRAVTLDRTEGLTKLILDPDTGRILGAGIAGPGAGELIAEVVVAMEMGALAEDLKWIIHPHPTLSETLMESAEAFFGESTHIHRPKRNREDASKK